MRTPRRKKLAAFGTFFLTFSSKSKFCFLTNNSFNPKRKRKTLTKGYFERKREINANSKIDLNRKIKAEIDISLAGEIKVTIERKIKDQRKRKGITFT